MKPTATLLLMLLVLTGCAHALRLVDLASGETLTGEFNTRSKEVTVWMKNGSILKGKYSAVQPGSVTFGSATGHTADGRYASASGYSTTVSNSGQAYAILTDGSGTVMEVIVTFSGNSGFGQAVTNKGKKYGIQF